MAWEFRRIACAAIVTAIVFAAGIAPAWAAFGRPNALDRRVDALTQSQLLSQPTIALVDPARQEAAIRLVHLTLPGWVAMALFQAAALAYFWSSGAAARVRDRLRRHLKSPWALRFLFGAVLGLIARLAALVPAFYLYRVERVMGLSLELTRSWAVLWIAHTLLAMVVAGIIAAIVLWLVDRTHQWYVYTIVVILAASIGWSYASPYFQLPGSSAQQPLAGDVAVRLHAMLAQAGLPNVPVYVKTSPSSPVGRAVVLGLGPSRRIVLSDTLVAGDTPAEVLYHVAYEIGRVMNGDLLFIALIEGGI